MIAISYRRDDSLPITGRLFDRLEAVFGRGSVFMDFDSIPYGVDFRDHIKQMIDRSSVLIAMIGPDWMGKRKRGSRRIDDPADFVRLEIAYALERKLPIIPVLIGNAQMPRAGELPKEIEDLAFRNGLGLDVGVDFRHHAERLVNAINGILLAPRPPSSTPQRARELAPVEDTLAPPETTLRRAAESPAGDAASSALPMPPPIKTPPPRTPSEVPEQKPTSKGSRPHRSKSPMETRRAIGKPSLLNLSRQKIVGLAFASLSLMILVTSLWYWEVKPSSDNRGEPNEKQKTSAPAQTQLPRTAHEQSPNKQPPPAEPTVSWSIATENQSSPAESSVSASATPSSSAATSITDWAPEPSALRDEHNRPIYIVVASESSILNVRSEHSARSPVIEKLKPGDRVFLEDGRVQNNDPPHPTTWQKVTTVNRATGWIAASFLAPADKQAEGSQPTPSDDAAVRQLFDRWLVLSNNGDAKQEALLYADSAEYLEFGLLNHEQLTQELEKDRERWPQQQYAVAKAPVVEKLGESQWRVAFEINFDVRNPSQLKRVTGTASITWTVRNRDSGGVEITSSKEQVTKRNYHDLKGGR